MNLSIRSLVARFSGILASLWVKRETEQPISTAIEIPRPRNDSENFGEFSFRDNILNQLDEYFVVLRRMKRGDPEAYDLYSKVGAHVISHAANLYYNATRLSPWWKQNRPSFGAISRTCLSAGKEGALTPKFIYFKKFTSADAPVMLERVAGGDVYVVTVYWDEPGDKKFKFGVPAEFGIHIDREANVRVLRMLMTSTRTFRARRNGKDHLRHHFKHSLKTKRWGHADFMKSWASEHGCSPEDFLLSVFLQAASQFEQANYSPIQIRATKQKISAVFSIDPKRSAYFFRDRDIVLNERGSKARIFHIVRAHSRKTWRGDRPIRLHFRGLRKFAWNGYDVHITVPGRHHDPVHALNAPWSELDKDDNSPIFDAKQMGGAVARSITEERPLASVLRQAIGSERALEEK